MADTRIIATVGGAIIFLLSLVTLFVLVFIQRKVTNEDKIKVLASFGIGAADASTVYDSTLDKINKKSAEIYAWTPGSKSYKNTMRAAYINSLEGADKAVYKNNEKSHPYRLYGYLMAIPTIAGGALALWGLGVY